MAITASAAAKYLRSYVLKYREAYERFTSPPPEGGGYPRLSISPYLYSKELTCYLATDGAVIVDFSFPRTDRWEVLVGPALIVDEKDNDHAPPSVTRLRKEVAKQNGSSGIYELKTEKKIPKEIWRGSLPSAITTATELVPEGTIKVLQFNIDWEELIKRLTFGAFCLVLDIKLPQLDSPFWTPRIIRHLGFAPGDLKRKQFYSYLELIRHLEDAAWDERSIWARVEVDISRDFIGGINPPAFGGEIELTSDKPQLQNVLTKFRAALDGLKRLIEQHGDQRESLFHQYLLKHPELLDLYGKPRYKPRLVYPQGQSPLGKKYVEPDFIIAYPGNRYKLVELERPSKKIGTAQGQTAGGVNQAAFQIAEWKTFIQKHYEQIKDEFPGIAVHCSSMLIIGTDSPRTYGEGRNQLEYMEIVKNQYDLDDVFTYSDILARAEAAYIRLAALT